MYGKKRKGKKVFKTKALTQEERSAIGRHIYERLRQEKVESMNMGSGQIVAADEEKLSKAIEQNTAGRDVESLRLKIGTLKSEKEHLLERMKMEVAKGHQKVEELRKRQFDGVVSRPARTDIGDELQRASDNLRRELAKTSYSDLFRVPI